MVVSVARGVAWSVGRVIEGLVCNDVGVASIRDTYGRVSGALNGTTQFQ